VHTGARTFQINVVCVCVSVCVCARVLQVADVYAALEQGWGALLQEELLWVQRMSDSKPIDAVSAERRRESGRGGGGDEDEERDV